MKTPTESKIGRIFSEGGNHGFDERISCPPCSA